MSGTSADGVDVALCRIGRLRRRRSTPRIKVDRLAALRYPKAVRAAVLAAMDAKSHLRRRSSRLNWRLGEVYAEASQHAADHRSSKSDLVGLSRPDHLSPGRRLASIWAAKCAPPGRSAKPPSSPSASASLSSATSVPPISPPAARALRWFPCSITSCSASAKINRVLQNLGGIANMTAIPAGCTVDDVLAFDTGPSNMVIDACMIRLFDKPFDRNGAWPGEAAVIRQVVDRLLREPYFSAPPPKSCGREEFGEAFVDRFIAMCRKTGARRKQMSSPPPPLSPQNRSSMPIADSSGLTSARRLPGARRRVCRRRRRRAKRNPDGHAASRARAAGSEGSRDRRAWHSGAGEGEQSRSRCWRGSPGTACREMFPAQPEPRAPSCWAR